MRVFFRAAHFCYYADLQGLIRPESSLELRASNANEDESVEGNYLTSGSTEIHIYRYVLGNERNSKKWAKLIIQKNTMELLMIF